VPPEHNPSGSMMLLKDCEDAEKNWIASNFSRGKLLLA